MTATRAEQPADMRRFFAPASVALVGATEDVAKFGGRCFRQLRNFGYMGRIYPVNPRYRELGGMPCYPSITDLPEPPDHVGLVVPADRTLDVLKEAAAKGSPFATVFTAGFSETGTERGRALQRELVDFARSAGIRIMGPNCNGLINFVDAFALTSTATISGPRAPAGDVGIVSHSGGLGQVNVMWRAQQAGLKISYEVSCGNDADLDMLDYARFMVEDPVTRVVLLACERVSDGAKLRSLAQLAHERGKAIAILKLGRTEAGSRMAASHTGAVTGADAVNDAAFRQFGIVRADDANELYETAMLLRTGRRFGPRLSAMSLSGGNTVLIADLAAEMGLNWPSFGAETQRAIAAELPAFGKVTNPTDITAGSTRGVFQRVFETLIADDHVDVMIPILTFASREEIENVATTAREATKPVVVLWTGHCNDDRSMGTEAFTVPGTPLFRDTKPMLRAIRRAADHAAFVARAATRTEPSRPAGIDLDTARRVFGAGALTERESKRVLAAYGLPVTREKLARSGDEAVAIAAEFGATCALKIDSPDILHKTEAGCVFLGLSGLAIYSAYDAILAAARRYAPDARLNGVLVQEMAPPGLEVMLGASRDPVFGPVVSVGLGGIYVEVLRDVAHRIPPLGPDVALDMLRELKVWPLLEGVRGQPPRDIDALCDAICRLSWLALDLCEEVAEIDVNPFILHERGRGGTVVDALIVRHAATVSLETA